MEDRTTYISKQVYNNCWAVVRQYKAVLLASELNNKQWPIKIL